MTHDEAFLESILETPDDDTPRLVYADWLDDHGQPERAEFIRLQIELARLPEEDERRQALERREEKLLALHEEEWLGPLRDSLPEGDTTPAFQRGFVSEICFWGPRGLRVLLAEAERLFQTAPVQGVRLWPAASFAPRLGPWESAKLEIYPLSATHLELLTRLPLLARLRELDCSGSVIEDIVEGGAIRVGNTFGDYGARMLADCPYLSGLHTLALVDTGIGDAGARALVDSPHLAKLSTLDLCLNPISEGFKQELHQRLGSRVFL